MKTDLKITVSLSLVALIAFWQVGLMQYPLRWDALNCFLAWRYNVTECFRNGEMPWWSPYQYLGFPLHADAETGAWYPFVWLLGLVREYDFYSLHFEWLLHVFIAGLGFFKLSRTLGISQALAFLGGVSFMLCGVFVSNAQNFIYLIGLSWMPWLARYIYLSYETGMLKYNVGFALCFFMLVTGSYPGITIITAYGLGVYALVRGVVAWRKRNLLQFIINNLRMALLSAGCTAVTIVSVWEYRNYLTRSEGLSASRILENPFPFKAYISFLLPAATASDQNFHWGSDISMINAYCGIATIAVIICWIPLRNKVPRQWWLLGGSLFLFAVALGDATPLRMWLAYLPGLGLFRHPSIFRFGGVFLLVLFAVHVAESLYRTHQLNKMILPLTMISMGLCITAYCYIPENACALLCDLAIEWFRPRDPSAIGVYDRIFAQSLLQLAFCVWLAFAFWKRLYRWILWTIVVHAVLCTQLNVPYLTVYDRPLAESQSHWKELPKGLSPYQGQPILQFESEKKYSGIWGIYENEYIFLKEPAWDGYNSFILSGYQSLEHAPEYPQVFNHPLVYGSDSTAVRHITLHNDFVEVEMDPNYQGPLVLQQNYHPNWKCLVDGVAVPVDTVNYCMQKVWLSEAGHTKVVFEYSPLATKIALGITIATLLLCIGLLIRGRPL